MHGPDISLLAIIFGFMTFLYIIAHMKQNNSIVDIGWGLGFIIIALTTFFKSSNHQPLHFIITGLIIIWGLRLAIHIYLRNKGKGEDKRYTAMRASWGKWHAIYSFFQVFMLQGFLMLIIAYPIILINSTSPAPLTMLSFIGLSMWFIGFFFESVGDYQLTQFLKNPVNKGRIMRYGLWKYTRHPNYFGELMMWWGIFISTISLPGGLFTIISPLMMTFLLLYVSGIPLLEKPLNENPEFQEYKKVTNPLIPWFSQKGPL